MSDPTPRDDALPPTAGHPAPPLLGRLRTRVAAAAAVAALIALLAGGLFVLASATSADRSDLDDGLVARATQAATVGRRTLAATGTFGRPAVRATRRVGRILGPVTGGSDVALIRVLRGDEVLDSLGATSDPGLPVDAPADPTTVDTADGRWRVVQRTIGRGIVVQAASPLATIDARHAALRDRLLLAGLVGVVGTGLLAFLLAGPALGALTRLRRDAGDVATTADLTVRMPADAGPVEVRELAGALNAMLSRLQAADADRRAALDTTQRFAADAGHELRTPLTALTTTVEVLRAHPGLPAEERTAMLEEIAEEHARLVALLDALQALARGDAGARTDRGPVDLSELAEQAVEAARAAAPGTTFALDAPASFVVDGWAPGLRLLLDNLLVNAVRHGRPGGRVVVTVATRAGGLATGGAAAGLTAESSAGDGTAGPGTRHDGPGITPGAASSGHVDTGPRAGAVLLVDDDGPGVPPGERTAVLGRFARGRATTVPGSGLGLALVDQQARLHGGRLTLEQAPAGGLRARVTLG
ncbi:HAMP domain-containing sensor histidine kinase [Patulibacter sp. NPDC049589]|uniref:HAMP domain-containing sensor histidine kinase n=1 Tax=Patulibacter sp. NPDC049589 TaxID=3154731 RepID=UPI00341818D6